MNLNQLTLVQSQQLLQSGKITSYDLVKSCLGQINKKEKQIKAFITVCEKDSLRYARLSDDIFKKNPSKCKKLPLLGIPIAIKDNFCTKEMPTTAASKILEDYVPVYNATVVARLLAAGAIIVGKTNMDAWAHGSSTETSDYMVTKNPWNIKFLPGGSSGGSAAAIAADMAISAIGSETAGSIRQPAAWCGVVGLKPTYGRVSRYGLIAMASSTDSPGPITKTVTDAAMMLKIIAGKDNFDATCSSQPVDDYPNIILNGFNKPVIGYCPDYLEHLTPAVKNCFVSVLDLLKQQQFKIIPIKLLDPQMAISVYTILQRAEVASNLARYDGIRYGKPRFLFGEEARRRIILGTFVLSAGYFDAYYKKAQQARTLIINDFKSAFKQVGLIIAPTSPCTALPIGSSSKNVIFGETQDMLLEPSSIAGLPGINLPAGLDKKGLPIGIQLIAPWMKEGLMLQLAKNLENELNFNKQNV